MATKFSKIRFGDGLSVTDEGDGVITVAGGGGGGGGGIQFDTEPQAGTWLYVETTGAATSGYGIEMNASDGIWLHGPNSLTLEGDAGADLTSASGNIGIHATGSGRSINIAADQQINLDTGGGFIHLRGTVLSLGHYTDQIRVTLASTKAFTIYKSDTTTKLLEVRDDGTVHIKTGASWAADL